MNAIAISPVIIKVIPNPFNGAGMCAYLTRSLIAANPIMASNQPIPLPKENDITSPMLAYSLCCINKDAPNRNEQYETQETQINICKRRT